MTVLASHVRPGTPEFEANDAEQRRLVTELRDSRSR